MNMRRRSTILFSESLASSTLRNRTNIEPLSFFGLRGSLTQSKGLKEPLERSDYPRKEISRWNISFLWLSPSSFEHKALADSPSGFSVVEKSAYALFFSLGLMTKNIFFFFERKKKIQREMEKRTQDSLLHR